MSIIKQTEVHMVPCGQAAARQVMFHNTWAGNSIGSYACDLIKAAMMASPPQHPAVLVDRCIEIADLTFKKFEEKGWLVELPSWDDLNEPTSRPGFVDHG